MAKEICPRTAERCDTIEACRGGNCRFGAGPPVSEDALSKDQLYKLRLADQRKSPAL